MSKAAEYQEFIESIRSGLGYWKSYSLLQFTSSLARLMKLDNLHGKGLASRLGVSTAQVSKVLSGQENVTIETMAKFADALDAVVHIHVAKKGVQVQWRELPPEEHTERAIAFEPPRAASRKTVR
ncbi:MAG TPA: helix-turn-helix transcriptional regulator [Thermoanaerobaculia bacterium]|nr:helix-turn-helix transcriptional regulator [Thermoanaerobaculia bacterium]